MKRMVMAFAILLVILLLITTVPITTAETRTGDRMVHFDRIIGGSDSVWEENHDPSAAPAHDCIVLNQGGGIQWEFNKPFTEAKVIFQATAVHEGRTLWVKIGESGTKNWVHFSIRCMGKWETDLKIYDQNGGDLEQVAKRDDASAGIRNHWREVSVSIRLFTDAAGLVESAKAIVKVDGHDASGMIAHNSGLFSVKARSYNTIIISTKADTDDTYRVFDVRAVVNTEEEVPYATKQIPIIDDIIGAGNRIWVSAVVIIFGLFLLNWKFEWISFESNDSKKL